MVTQHQTTTLERPDTRTADQDDAPKFFHYVQKDKVVDSVVNGTFVVALCGESFPVTAQAKPDSPVCPECERIYRTLRRR